MRMISKVSLGMIAMALGTGAFGQISGPVPLAWRWQAPSRGVPPATPAVDGDWIFQNSGGRIFCLDRTTGTQKWKFPNVDPIPGNFRTSLILSGDSVIGFSDSKIVYAVNKSNGEIKWTKTLDTAVSGQPILIGNTIVFISGGNRVMAIDANSGNSLWENGFLVLDGISSGLAGYRNSFIFISNKNRLVSVDLATQKINYTVPPFQALTSGTTPTVVGDQVFVNSGRYLIALNADAGSVNWQKPVAGRLTSSPSANKDIVWVFMSDNGGQAAAFTTSGDLLTEKPIVFGSNPVGTPVALGTKAVVGLVSGGFALLDTKEGVTWQYSIRPNPEYKVIPASSTTGGSNGNFGGPGGGGLGGGGLGGGGQASGEGITPPTVAPSAGMVVASDTLLVPVRDGSLLAFDKTLGVDLTAPKVSMRFPNPGDQVSGQPPLQLWFKVEDDATGIKASTLNVEIDGKKVDAVLDPTGFVTVRFSVTGKNKPLSDGRKSIVVTVSDWIGNVRKAEYFITIDNSLNPVKLPGTQNNGMDGGLGGPGAGGAGSGGLNKGGG